MNNQKLEVLIHTLLDKEARLDERDDAAMDLVNFPSSEALSALITIATDPSEKNLLSVCGEAVATIMFNLNQIDMRIINKLLPEAKSAAIRYLNSD